MFIIIGNHAEQKKKQIELKHGIEIKIGEFIYLTYKIKYNKNYLKIMLDKI